MAVSSKNIKGLQDIRTHSGKVSEGVVPHKAYMRLTCLEMEKYRRDKERKSAMARVENIDNRFRDIEMEKENILASLGVREKIETGYNTSGGNKQMDRSTANGFVLRY